MAILNQYKNILDDFLNRLDLEFLLGPIDKGSCNMSWSRGGLSSILDKNCLDEDVSVLDKSSRLAPKTRDF